MFNTSDRRRFGLLMGGLLAACSTPSSHDARFVVYYGLTDTPGLDDFDLAVLEAELDPAAVRRFARRGALALGYLSLCEVHMGRRYAGEVLRAGLLHDANAAWPQSRYVDLRDRRWQALVLDRLVPALLDSGFGGLFLDTLDDAAYLEGADPQRHAGMADAAVGLVRALRRRYSQLPLMINRGYALRSGISGAYDMLMAESLHSTFDAATGRYRRVEPPALQWQLDQLDAARRADPRLALYALDYWPADDAAGRARLYDEARSRRLVPYVGTFDLMHVVAR